MNERRSAFVAPRILRRSAGEYRDFHVPDFVTSATPLSWLALGGVGTDGLGAVAGTIAVSGTGWSLVVATTGCVPVPIVPTRAPNAALLDAKPEEAARQCRADAYAVELPAGEADVIPRAAARRSPRNGW